MRRRVTCAITTQQSLNSKLLWRRFFGAPKENIFNFTDKESICTMHKFRIKDPESVGFLLGSLVIFQGVRPSTQNQ